MKMKCKKSKQPTTNHNTNIFTWKPKWEKPWWDLNPQYYSTMASRKTILQNGECTCIQEHRLELIAQLQ